MAKVVCVVCAKEPAFPDEVSAPNGRWMCQECMDKGYSLNFLDWIKTRIAVTRTEDEDRSKFVIRELVQNADDAEATILVLRFERDALYVANNGRAFTTVGPGGSYEGCDFDRSSRVLKRFKEFDKESTGHFGSGFQTVYAITNHPEVHSNVVSRALNPLSMEWNNLKEHLHSPYAGSKDERTKGVLFRLPWRDEVAAKEVVGAQERPFAASDFPRWGTEAVRSFYDDLKGYLGDVLLCCQRLKAIRIVWNADSHLEAYQAERDFTLNVSLETARVVTVRQGQAGTGRGWYAWDPRSAVETGVCPGSFDPAGWSYQEPEVRSYFAASKLVKNQEGKTLFFLKGSRGGIRVDVRKSAGDIEIKKNHVHLLFPLFVAKRQYLYSVIPLPARGRNRFAFSAHLFPVENRTGVDIQGNDGVNGEWYRECMKSITSLYRETFLGFLQSVRRMGLVLVDAQVLVLQSLPIGEIREWMRPDKEDIQWGVEEGKSLRDWLFDQQILVTADGTSHAPSRSYYVSNDTERSVVELLGMVAMPNSFTSKFDEIHWLRDMSEKVQFTEKDFASAWTALERDGPLRYGTNVGPTKSVRLDKATVESVLRYALSSKSGDALRGLALVPDAVGQFRAINSFPKLPPSLVELVGILAQSRTIHPDFAATLEELETVRAWRPEVAFNEVPGLIDTEFRGNPARFGAMSEEDHRLISRIVHKVVTHESWALDKAINKNFIPYDLGGVRSLGSPPDVRQHRGHEGENYRREWIFASQPFPVPGLTPELRRRIKIFDLKGFAESERRRVSSRLDIVALAEIAGDPTNYVRNFISPRLGSLFEDRRLADFLGTDVPDTIERQKRAMLEAVKAYFNKPKTERGVEPDDMGKVPCLFDREGAWHPARKFARGAGPILDALGLVQLNQHFDGWPIETLQALQVVVEPDLANVAQIIRNLASERLPDRRCLANIFGTLLAEYDSAQLSSIGGNLREVEWVPIGVTKTAKPKDAILPTQDKISVLGESHRSYVDLDVMDKEVRAKVEALADKAGAKAFLLGLAIAPSLPEMTEVLVSSISKGMEPPKSLQESISKALAQNSVADRERWRTSLPRPALHWKGRWYDGPRIRILAKMGGFPVPFNEVGLLVLSTDEALPIEELAKALGASSGVQLTDLILALVWISNKARSDASTWPGLRQNYDAIWKWLDSHYDEIPGEAKGTFAGERIIFAANSWQSAMEVVLADGGTIKSPVSFGKWSVVPVAHDAPSAMERLGARRISQLTIEDVKRLLATLAEGTVVGQEQTEAILSLLKVPRESERDALNGIGWPVKESNEVRIRNPRMAFVGNQSLLGLFPAVPQAITTANGQHDRGLKALVLALGARPLEESLSYPDLSFAQANRATDMEAVLSEAYTRLVSFNPEDIGALSWLHGLEIWRAPNSIQRYSAGESAGRFSVPTVVPLKKGRTVLLLRKEAPSLDESAVKALVDWALGEGLAPEKRANLVPMLLQLYRDREEALDYDYAVERQRPGYNQTLQRLATWYHACQLCGDVTPKDDKGLETAENIRSMISNRGGLFRGRFDSYDPSNSLYLCPRHAILLQRGLVRFRSLEGWEHNKEQVIESLREAAKHIPDGEGMWEIDDVEVYEWNWDDPDDKKQEWNTRSLKLTPTHAKMIFERLIRYVGTRE